MSATPVIGLEPAVVSEWILSLAAEPPLRFARVGDGMSKRRGPERLRWPGDALKTQKELK